MIRAQVGSRGTGWAEVERGPGAREGCEEGTGHLGKSRIQTSCPLTRLPPRLLDDHTAPDTTSLRHRCALPAGMYYGGEPVQWTDSPSMPHEARYEVMNKPKPPPVPAAAAAAAGGGGGGAAPAGARQYAVAGSRVVNKHPLSEVRTGVFYGDFLGQGHIQAVLGGLAAMQGYAGVLPSCHTCTALYLAAEVRPPEHAP